MPNTKTEQMPRPVLANLLYPSAAPIVFKGGRILRQKWGDMFERYAQDSFFQTMPIGYLHRVIDKRYPDRRAKKLEFDDFEWAVVEITDRRVQQQAVVALLDLFIALLQKSE